MKGNFNFGNINCNRLIKFTLNSIYKQANDSSNSNGFGNRSESISHIGDS